MLSAALLGIVRHCRSLAFDAEPEYERLQADLRHCRGDRTNAEERPVNLDWIASVAGLTSAAKTRASPHETRHTATAVATTAVATNQTTASRARAAESPARSRGEDAIGARQTPRSPRSVPLDATVLTLQQLQDGDLWRAMNIPPDRREQYLADTEFEAVFGMAKKTFEVLPRWRRIQKKKQYNLF